MVKFFWGKFDNFKHLKSIKCKEGCQNGTKECHILFEKLFLTPTVFHKSKENKISFLSCLSEKHNLPKGFHDIHNYYNNMKSGQHFSC